FFPSVSAGWIVSDEPFMQGKTGWMNFLKIRGSFGVTGNQPEGNYLGYNNYIVNNAAFAGADGNWGSDLSTSYNGTPVITPNYFNGIAQRNLSWEESRQGNIGVDMGLFKDRVRLTADLYNRQTTKGFFNYLLPNASGY